MKVTVLPPSRDSCFDDESSEDTARGEWWTAKAALVVARRRFKGQDDDVGTRAKIIAENAIIAKIIVENNMVGSIGTRFYLHSLLCCGPVDVRVIVGWREKRKKLKRRKKDPKWESVYLGDKLPVTGLRHCTVSTYVFAKKAAVNAKNSCCPPMKPVETSAVLQEAPYVAHGTSVYGTNTRSRLSFTVAVLCNETIACVACKNTQQNNERRDTQCSRHARGKATHTIYTITAKGNTVSNLEWSDPSRQACWTADNYLLAKQAGIERLRKIPNRELVPWRAHPARAFRGLR